MSEMDRPDGLNWMRVAAAVGLAVLSIVSVGVGFLGTLWLFYTVTMKVYYLIYGDHVIAAVVTLGFLVALIAWRRRLVGRWLAVMLGGLTLGSWIAALMNGGSVSV